MALNNAPDSAHWLDRALTMRDDYPDWQPDATEALTRFRAGRSAQRTRTRRRSWTVVTVATMALTLMSFPDTRALAARCVDACVQLTSKVTGLWPDRDPRQDTGALLATDLRPVAPSFSLPDVNGTIVRLDDLRGQVVLVNFWATWCAPCAVEIPWFAEFQARHKARGLAVLGVSLDEDGWTAVQPFADAHHVRYPLVLAPDDLVTAYGGIGALPSTFLIDRHGRIAARRVGLVPKAEYEAQIETLLAEREAEKWPLGE